jgi:hypothetical protein
MILSKPLTQPVPSEGRPSDRVSLINWRVVLESVLGRHRTLTAVTLQ